MKPQTARVAVSTVLIILNVLFAVIITLIPASTKPNHSNNSGDSHQKNESQSTTEFQKDEWKIKYDFEEGKTESKTYLKSPNGKQWEISAKYANSIVNYTDSRCIVYLQSDTGVGLWLADVKSDKLNLLTGEQYVIDYTVAYDTLYWYNINREVWACSWLEEYPTSSLYCEDALGVSPHSDEAEGAIVSPDRANWDGYGLPIDSPYGRIEP